MSIFLPTTALVLLHVFDGMLSRGSSPHDPAGIRADTCKGLRFLLVTSVGVGPNFGWSEILTAFDAIVCRECIGRYRMS